ncbi:proteasome subunit beta [Streptomyces sp. NPDC050560]|uniref:proteasome subunit beta n=1 Tax=Streptomyces sp. NPDC050560 TaxID=3365630 RepID=UPI0037B57919
MEANPRGIGRLPAAFLRAGSSSFTEFLSEHRPELLPGARSLPAGPGRIEAPHGTTIVAATFPGGVVLAADRRSTMGNVIARRDAVKVHPADEFSAVGFAGTAGFSIEMVKLFQLELEHFEKVEGTTLSLEGKANRLSTMIRSHLELAMQGLAVVPIFVGWDVDRDRGRIFSYDVTGGRSEEHGFAGVGSGSVYARGALKKLYRDDLTERDAATLVVQALYDAADEDSATGGPDATRKIWPVVTVTGPEGFRQLPEDDTAEIARAVIDARLELPDGPRAALM